MDIIDLKVNDAYERDERAAYRHLSQRTCQRCGAPARYMTWSVFESWLTAVCAEHYDTDRHRNPEWLVEITAAGGDGENFNVQVLKQGRPTRSYGEQQPAPPTRPWAWSMIVYWLTETFRYCHPAIRWEVRLP